MAEKWHLDEREASAGVVEVVEEQVWNIVALDCVPIQSTDACCVGLSVLLGIVDRIAYARHAETIDEASCCRHENVSDS